MPKRRFTASRGGKHTRIDRLDVVGFLARTAFAALVNLIGLGWALHDQTSRLPLFAVLTLAVLVTAVIMFGGNLVVERIIRPRVFDREQRQHEIVPSQPDERPARA